MEQKGCWYGREQRGQPHYREREAEYVNEQSRGQQLPPQHGRCPAVENHMTCICQHLRRADIGPVVMHPRFGYGMNGKHTRQEQPNAQQRLHTEPLSNGSEGPGFHGG